MEDDEYYLDTYDCQPSPETLAANGLPSTSQSPSHDNNIKEEEEEGLSSINSLTMGVSSNNGGGEDGGYQDDYDHVYVDTAGAELYLRTIWSQLNVGLNGYLNLSELYQVCEHIGMSASPDMIEQLFDKLDNDQDGRVSFAEFVDGLFKYVHRASHHATPDVDSSRLPPSECVPPQSTLDHASSSSTMSPEAFSFAHQYSDVDRSADCSPRPPSDVYSQTSDSYSVLPNSSSSSSSTFISISTDKDG